MDQHGDRAGLIPRQPADPFAGVFGKGGFFGGLPFEEFQQPDQPPDQRLHPSGSRDHDGGIVHHPSDMLMNPPQTLTPHDIIGELFRGLSGLSDDGPGGGGGGGGPGMGFGMGPGTSTVRSRSQQTRVYHDERGERIKETTVRETINGHTTTMTTVTSSDGTVTSTTSDGVSGATGPLVPQPQGRSDGDGDIGSTRGTVRVPQSHDEFNHHARREAPPGGPSLGDFLRRWWS